MALREMCKPCAVELSKTRAVTYKTGGVNRKGTCWVCGRRRYVATYSVQRFGPSDTRRR